MNELTTADARVQRVKDLTDGRGADVVVEVVGVAAATLEGSTWSDQRHLRRHRQHHPGHGDAARHQGDHPADQVDGLMHYNPWIMPAALDFLVRTRDRFPLSSVVSHSFPLADVNKAFAFAEWQGKNTGPRPPA